MEIADKSNPAASTVTLLHFSDVHLSAARTHWHASDFLSKRVTGWLNLRLLGRSYRFRHAPRVVEALIVSIRQLKPDQCIFTGDATTLAFEEEMAESARRLHVGDDHLPPAVAVPGNHDRYTFQAERSRSFESHFAPWLEGRRLDGETFPFARKVGHVWLIGLNSSRATFMPWDASGRVGEPQLDRLRRLTDLMDPGPRILFTHYPLLTNAFQPEPITRRLRDWRRVRDVLAECGIHLYLHGHRHRWYILPVSPDLPFPSIGAGSATQTGRWGFNLYRIKAWNLHLDRYNYQPDKQSFELVETRELNLLQSSESARLAVGS